jgi:8-oxo-dGTP pyrophosphatase MutT (NUDIX family)
MAHVRTLVVSAGSVLLVEHHDPRDDKTFWMPPGGGSEEGETFEDAARREVKEETGVDVTVLRQVPIPAERGYLLFEAQLVGAPDVTPEIEPCEQEIHTTGAAWHRVTADAPLGPMEHAYWGELAPLILSLLGRKPDAPTRARPE